MNRDELKKKAKNTLATAGDMASRGMEWTWNHREAHRAPQTDEAEHDGDLAVVPLPKSERASRRGRMNKTERGLARPSDCEMSEGMERKTMKKLVVIATAMLAGLPSMADNNVIDYRLSKIYTYPKEPGCTMSVYDSVGRQLSPGLKEYFRSSGTTCTVYRDGIEIGTFLTKGDNKAYFTDYNVIPGETYNYEIHASYGGYSASAVSQQTCQYVYRVELGANKLMFDAEGGESRKQNLQVSIYKQYSNSSVPYSFKSTDVKIDKPSWANARFASDTQSSGGNNDQESRMLEIWTTPNENGSIKEGLVTISYSGYSIPVRIVQAAKEVSYSSWATANGLSGTWDAKDKNGIYNVFRYAFGVPTGNFTETPLISIKLVDGKPMIKTPAIVNMSGFTFSVKASDKADGTGNITNYLLNASGETIIEDEVKPSRFFRLKVVQQ